MKIRVSLFDSIQASSVEAWHLTMTEIAELIEDTRATEKAHLPLLKLATFGDYRTKKGSLRHDRNMHWISGCELDYDGGQVSFEAALSIAEKQPLQCLLYTSPSHSPQRPRWRLLAPTSKEYPSKDRKRFVDRVNGAYGGIFSSESWTASQSFYFGRLTTNPYFEMVLVDGEFVDQLHDLDLIARGKTPIGHSGNGHAFEGGTAGLTEAQLAGLIRSGAHYHEPTLRLATIWARQGVDQSQAEDDIEDLFDEVPLDQQDRERWGRRKAEVHRCVADMYLGVAREAEQQEERRAAELADLEARIGPDPPPPPRNGHDRKAEDGDRASQAQHHWGQPAELSFRDPWATPEPPQWPPDVLPVRFHDMVFELGLSAGLDPGAQGIATLSAASGAAPKNARFFPYGTAERWAVPPIIWAIIIQQSGQRKSALDTPFEALQRKHSQLWLAYHTQLRGWRALSTKDRNNTPKPPEPHSFVVTDTTPEKLQHVLAETNRGTLLLRDELAGFFGFGRYSNDKGAAERAFYLESYEGGPYTVHRAARDSFHIEVNGLTVFGRIQPERLSDFPDLQNDGLLQRFITIAAAKASVGRELGAITAKDDFDERISQLTELPGRAYRTTQEGSDIVRRMEVNGIEFATLTDYGPGFSGFCGKLHGTLARIALILHLLEQPDPQITIIHPDIVHRADRLVRDFVLPHTLNFYSALAPERLERTRSVADWLLTSAPPTLRASDFGKHTRSCRGLSLADLNAALDPLVTGGWLEPATPFPGNREWKLKIEVREAMAYRVAAAAARREKNRQLAESIGKSNQRPPP